MELEKRQAIFEPMMVKFTCAYMLHPVALNYTKNKERGNAQHCKSSVRQIYLLGVTASWKLANTVNKVSSSFVAFFSRLYIVYDQEACAKKARESWFVDVRNIVMIQLPNKVWCLCLVPTSTTRFASDVGYIMAKIKHSCTRKIFFMNNDI